MKSWSISIARILGVDVRLHTRGAPVSGLPADSVQRLAALVRDHVPDVPAAAPRDVWNSGGGGDPCALLEGFHGRACAHGRSPGVQRQRWSSITLQALRSEPVP